MVPTEQDSKTFTRSCGDYGSLVAGARQLGALPYFADFPLSVFSILGYSENNLVK